MLISFDVYLFILVGITRDKQESSKKESCLLTPVISQAGKDPTSTHSGRLHKGTISFSKSTDSRNMVSKGKLVVEVQWVL